MEWNLKINSEGAQSSIKNYEKNSEDTLNALKIYMTNLDDILGKGWKGTASEKFVGVISEYQESTLKFVDKINDHKEFMKQVVCGFGDLHEKSNDVGKQMQSMNDTENQTTRCKSFSDVSSNMFIYYPEQSGLMKSNIKFKNVITSNEINAEFVRKDSDNLQTYTDSNTISNDNSKIMTSHIERDRLSSDLKFASFENNNDLKKMSVYSDNIYISKDVNSETLEEKFKKLLEGTEPLISAIDKEK